MSRIDDLGENYEKLPDLIDEYQTALDQAEGNIQISGKRIDLANIEQASWLAYYDERLFRQLTENNARDLSDRAKDKYIDSEPAYLEMYSIYLEIHEMYEQFIAIVDAFKARGFALNNLVKLKVAAVEETVL